MVDKSLQRRENLYSKIVKSGQYTIDEIKQLDSKDWYKAGFTSKILRKNTSKKAFIRLLDQIANEKHTKNIIDYFLKKEQITNTKIIESFISETNRIFNTSIPELPKLIIEPKERFDLKEVEKGTLLQGNYWIAYCKDENDKEFWIKYDSFDDFIRQVQIIENDGSGKNLTIINVTMGTYQEFRDVISNNLLKYM